jgi:hypothetical protein
MRKGRSQRKTRGSLPPTSKRLQSRLAAPSSAGPQVVVGHAAPRAEEPLDTSRHADARGVTLELAEGHRLELVREPSLEIEATQAEATQAEATQAEQPQTPRVETLTFAVAEASSSDFDEPSVEPGQALAVNARATAAVKPESRGSHVTSLPTPDEMSIPPMGDLSVEPIADRFFSEGELVAARADHEAEEWDEPAHKLVRKSLPEVVQRRARFAKYVRWAVGGAAVLCLAAAGRSVLPSGGASAAPASVAQSARLEAPASKAASVAIIAPAEPPAAVATAASVTPVAPAAPAAAQGGEPATTVEAVSAPVVAVPAAAAATADAPATPAVATSDKTALQEKNDSRRALERGKLADAIAAGERAVALDPTDGEAWLLLGAAYQEKGKNADARRCYSSCVKEGKRGPLGECRALLH